MASLEDKILRGLKDIGYNGHLLKLSELQAATEIGQKGKDFTELVQFLTKELRTLLSLDEQVNAVTSPGDAVAFVMEITSFLKELSCPYKALTQGLVSERLQKYCERLLLLDYLITELMVARILHDKKPEKKIELKLRETPEGADMRQILQTLRFPKPPANITIKQLFDKIDTTLSLVLKKTGTDLVGEGIFNGVLSDKQCEALKGVHNDLNNEYKIRREMILTRLDVTIQSFQWSDKTKGKEHLFEKIYCDKRKLLHADPDVDMSDLIAARTELAIIEKTSNASVRKNTQTPINKVIIGQVPDRGGRSWEQAPPPPEMPSWQQNRAGGPTTGAQRGRGDFSNRGGFGGRGGRGNDRNRNESGGYQGRNSGNYQDSESTRGYSGQGREDYGQKRYSGGSQYDSRGSYDNRYSNNYYDNRGGTSSYDVGTSSYDGGNSSYENRGYSYNRRDSGGYSGPSHYQQNKRPKTYDNFQASKSTYADQYVQESQHNQQYQRGGRGFYHRGRSNYNRGGSRYR
ncbi:protein FAM98B-like [Euwallacea similis]|uniref:protein FAM98B-like n=1 Tax=Euwallacea similis TaxID=1736056 RepID=UPI00344B06F0